MEDLFCGNSSSSQGSWPSCQQIWHAKCYTSWGELPTFPTMTIEDELGNPWHKEEESQRRINQGVSGAHMCIPFQCEVCWMRNLEARNPIARKDNVFVAYIKRANRDAMLGKSPLKTANHVREYRTVITNVQN